MTTKEQERKALGTIRKIVEELGPDSYISMAFEGCFEIAEENIDNDFGCSLFQKVVAAEKRADKAEREIRELREVLRDAQTKLDVANKEIEAKQREVNQQRENVDHWRQHSLEQGAEINRLTDLRDKLMNKEREMSLEIIKLKAKLFDLMRTEE